MWTGEKAYRYDRSGVTMTGGTRWADPSEIKAVLTQVDMTQDSIAGCGAPLISDGRTAYVNNADSHTLIIGSTGSKKTRLVIMPTIETIARAGESLICTDPKGELYERTSGLFAKNGYELRVFNLRDPLHSHGWSVLHDAVQAYAEGRTEDAYTIVSDFAAALYPANDRQDPFWEHSARILFSGICNMLVEKPELFQNRIHLNTIRPLLANALKEDRWGIPGDLDPEELLENYDPETSQARHQVEMVSVGSERTGSNIMISALAPLGVFYSRPSLTNMLSTPQICMGDIGLKKTAVFIILPDEKTTLNLLVSLFIKRSYEELIRIAQQQPDLKLPVRVNYVLDEFCNVPTIPDMNAMISAARSRNIRFQLVVQGFHQLWGKYGHDADNIKGNCNDWLFLASREWDLLCELSNLCGHDESTGRSLISTTELQRLSKERGEALLLCGRCYPIITYLADISQYPSVQRQPVSMPCLRPTQPPEKMEFHPKREKMSKTEQPVDTPLLIDTARMGRICVDNDDDDPDFTQLDDDEDENDQPVHVVHLFTPVHEVLSQTELKPSLEAKHHGRVSALVQDLFDFARGQASSSFEKVSQELQEQGINTIGELIGAFHDLDHMRANLRLKSPCDPSVPDIVEACIQANPQLLNWQKGTIVEGRYTLLHVFSLAGHVVWSAVDTQNCGQIVWLHRYDDVQGCQALLWNNPQILNRLKKVECDWILMPLSTGCYWGRVRYVVTPTYTKSNTLLGQTLFETQGSPTWLLQYYNILKGMTALYEAGLHYGLMSPSMLLSDVSANKNVALYDFRWLSLSEDVPPWLLRPDYRSGFNWFFSNPDNQLFFPSKEELPLQSDIGVYAAEKLLLWFVSKLREAPATSNSQPYVNQFIEPLINDFAHKKFIDLKQLIKHVKLVLDMVTSNN